MKKHNRKLLTIVTMIVFVFFAIASGEPDEYIKEQNIEGETARIKCDFGEVSFPADMSSTYGVRGFVSDVLFKVVKENSEVNEVYIDCNFRLEDKFGEMNDISIPLFFDSEYIEKTELRKYSEFTKYTSNVMGSSIDYPMVKLLDDATREILTK